MCHVRLFVIAVILFFVPAVSFAAADGLVAKVGDVPIMAFEVESQASRIMPFNVTYHGEVTEEKKREVSEKALSELVLRAYKVCYANSLKLVAPEDQIEEKIDKARARFDSDEAFAEAVSIATVEGLRASLRRDLLAKMAEDQAVNSKIIISDEDVEVYYQENKHTFFKPRQFRASHILIKVDPAATEDVRNELREKAEGLMEKARSGEDFYNLAYYNSEDRTSFVGGDMGMFHEGQAVKPIEEALTKIKVGEISDVVETLVGFHVLKLTQADEPRQLGIDEVGSSIRALLEKKQREILYDEWIENLKIIYKVERFDS